MNESSNNGFQILQILLRGRCHICDRNLFVPPIFSNEDGSRYQCGRCPAIGNEMKTKHVSYETFLRHLKISCRFEGCTESMSTNEVDEHEKRCGFRRIPCPLPDICSLEFRHNQLVQHMRESHAGNLQYGKVMNFQLAKDRYTAFVMVTDEIPFLILFSTDKVSVTPMESNISRSFYLKLSSIASSSLHVLFRNQRMTTPNDKTVNCTECFLGRCRQTRHRPSNFISLGERRLGSIFGEFREIEYTFYILSEEEGKHESGSGISILSYKPEIFDTALRKMLRCIFCVKYMIGLIFNCLWGHPFCMSCKKSVSTCWLCRAPIKDSRNVHLEKVANNPIFLCSKPGGCYFVGKLALVLLHEEYCFRKSMGDRSLTIEDGISNSVGKISKKNYVDTKMNESSKNGFQMLQILLKGRCHICDRNLFVPPIFSNEDGSRYQCGRCPAIGNEMKTKHVSYETFLRHLKISCRFEGCTESMSTDEVNEHEKRCGHRRIPCPLPDICSLEFGHNQLVQHMRESHAGNLQYGKVMNFQLVKDRYTAFVMVTDEIPFLILFSTDKVSVTPMKQNISRSFYLKLSSIASSPLHVLFRNQRMTAPYDQTMNCTDCFLERCRQTRHRPSNFISLGEQRLGSIFGDFREVEYTFYILSEEEGKHESGSGISILSYKPEIFDTALRKMMRCLICVKYMSGLIFNCLWGHPFCMSCKKVVSTCWLCRAPIKESRNGHLEKVAKIPIFLCSKPGGCYFVGNLALVLLHEEYCFRKSIGDRSLTIEDELYNSVVMKSLKKYV